MNHDNKKKHLVFLCGSLEPGKDGVGDYVRTLSTALNNLGVHITAISLYDKHRKLITTEKELVADVMFNILRIPSNETEKKRWESVQQLITKESPDWISLQFVPYSFDPRGIPLHLPKRLRALKGNFKWHIMFHELWLENSGTYKQRVISFLQQYIVMQCIKKLKPVSVNTSIKLNQLRLNKQGIHVEILELFGNIPVHIKDTSILPEQFNNVNSEKITILYFGATPRDAFRDLLINKLKEFSLEISASFNLILVTGENADKSLLLTVLKKEIPENKMIIQDMGFLDAKTLSALMQTCSAGIVRSEPEILGKSGSAMAMLEHGLPVWMPKWMNNKKLDFTYRTELVHKHLSDAVQFQNRPIAETRVSAIAIQFVQQLNQ